MALSVGHCFLFVILTIYFTFTYLTANEYFLTYVSEAFWCSNILSTVFVSTFLGELASREVRRSDGKKYSQDLFFLQANKTSSHVHKILNRTNRQEVSRKFMYFSQQLLHRQPKFSCGLFSFDAELAFKVRIISLENKGLFIENINLF